MTDIFPVLVDRETGHFFLTRFSVRITDIFPVLVEREGAFLFITIFRENDKYFPRGKKFEGSHHCKAAW